jgi:RNA polymerase sigma-70 factor (ECF subfamily)
VLQDVLVLVFRKLKWLETPALFRPWAFRIASRAGFRRLKRVSRLSEREIDERTIVGVPAPDTAPPEALLEQLHTISGLSPASRAVLVLHYQEDMTLPDIAAVLDLPLGTVKSRLAYGLTTLRKQVGRRRPDDRTLRNGTS